ncbi:MAG: baeRF10 domain-containing protein, partial [Anaerolineae bacterium]
PLSNLLDQYAPYVVALVDQERARLFLIDMGGIVKEEDVVGDPIKRQKQGGWSASRWQRHTDQQAQHNMRAMADALSRLCADEGCQRLVLAGTEENTAAFRDLMPMPLRQRVLGTIALDIAATAPVVVERSRALLTDLDERRKDELVQRAVTAASKGGPGVTGLPDTLLALQEGRVMNLLVEEGFAAPGYECPSCDYHYVDEAQRCLFCGDAQALKVRNVVERAVHKAYLQGAAVEVVSGNADLARMGHIAALLRY